MPELVVDFPDGTQIRQAFVGDELVLGRDSSLELQLLDAKVSRRHARVWSHRKAFWIEDLGSSNGVLLDGVPLKQPQPFGPNSVAFIGPFAIRLEEEASGPAVQTQQETRWLLVSRSPAVSTDIPLPVFSPHSTIKNKIVVGRGGDCQVIIDEQSISRRHAELQPVQGGVEVTDLDSSNGCFVNDQAIKRGMMAAGDLLRMGNITFVLMATGGQSRVGVDAKRDHPSQSAASPAAQQHGQPKQSIRLHFKKRLKYVALVAAAGLTAGGGMMVVRHPPAKLMAPPHSTRPQAKWAWWLMGRGPCAAERQRLIFMAKAKQAALGSMQDKAFIKAANQWTEVLQKDPANEAGLAGLVAAREAQRLQIALDQAATSVGGSDPTQTLALIASALDNPWTGALQALALADPCADTRASLAQYAQEAKSALASAAGTRAANACIDGQWSTCVAQAMTAHSYDAKSAVSEALLAWVHDALGNPLKELQTRYKQDDLRQTMWIYASGLDEAALVRIKPLLCPNCLATARTLRALIKQKHEANTALVAGEPERALEILEQARVADAGLIPASVPSVGRLQIVAAMQHAYVAVGQAAFERGSYTEALQAWQQGQNLGPEMIEIQDALTKLHLRAEQMYSAWLKVYGQDKIGRKKGNMAADACLPLREVVSMTAQEDPLHLTAINTLDACRHGDKSRASGAKAPKIAL